MNWSRLRLPNPRQQRRIHHRKQPPGCRRPEQGTCPRGAGRNEGAWADTKASASKNRDSEDEEHPKRRTGAAKAAPFCQVAERWCGGPRGYQFRTGGRAGRASRRPRAPRSPLDRRTSPRILTKRRRATTRTCRTSTAALPAAAGASGPTTAARATTAATNAATRRGVRMAVIGCSLSTGSALKLRERCVLNERSLDLPRSGCVPFCDPQPAQTAL